jgi:hypothetical protein
MVKYQLAQRWDPTKKDHIDKAYYLASIDGFILISLVSILIYLIKKKGLEMDHKSKVFIILYLVGRTINLISWIIDLLEQN